MDMTSLFVVRCSPDFHDRVQAAAEARGMVVSKVVRGLLDGWLRDTPAVDDARVERILTDGFGVATRSEALPRSDAASSTTGPTRPRRDTILAKPRREVEPRLK